MENKYFTPDIEDIHVGYECEVLIENTWKKATLIKILKMGILFQCIEKDFEWTFTAIRDELRGNYIRVPYLTKEQIEAEGWEQDERYNDEKHFYKNNIYLRLYIGYHYNEIITYNISIFNEDGILFKGKCKDINTFRKIIKLLGI